MITVKPEILFNIEECDCDLCEESRQPNPDANENAWERAYAKYPFKNITFEANENVWQHAHMTYPIKNTSIEANTKQNKIDVTRLRQAAVEGMQSTCVKHQVGCIITNKQGRIVASGYNGTAVGHCNCNDHFPNFKNEYSNLIYLQSMGFDNSEQINQMNEAHHQFGRENEIHAEVNALLHANRSDIEGGTLYSTHQPCADCSKAIANSGIKRVVYGIPYERTSESTINMITKNCGYEHIDCVIYEVNGELVL